jgi:CSLREA domain-containing protein
MTPTVTLERRPWPIRGGAVLATLLLAASPAAFAALFTVTSTADTGGNCSATPTSCTLRQAISSANATAVADTIQFAIPGNGPHLIAPASALPAITRGLTIDGYTQPGAVENASATGFDATLKIQLSGANTALAAGLRAAAPAAVTIRGLSITEFGGFVGGVSGRGIEADGSGAVLVQGCAIGVTPSFAVAANRNGIQITADQTGAVSIGSLGSDATALANRNLISGNSTNGVIAFAGTGAVNVLNNLIGTGPAGGAPLGTQLLGIQVQQRAGAVVRDNKIKGNGTGIVLHGPDFEVTGNVIGREATDPPGSANGVGIRIQGTASGTGRIGGSGALANQILRNVGDGIEHAATGLDADLAFNRSVGNGALPVDLLGLDGPDANDPADADGGPNGLQNRPATLSATRTSAAVNAPITIAGTLSSLPQRTFRISFVSTLGVLGDVTTQTVTGTGGDATFGPLQVVFPDSQVDSINVYATLIDDLSGLPRATSEAAVVTVITLPPPQAFVVNSTLDPGDGTCDATQCTLREAIEAANANFNQGAIDSIGFALAGAPGTVHTIVLGSPLPEIGEPVTIDGYTQAGAVPNSDASGVASNAELKVEIAGGNFHFNEFATTAASVTLRGLSITGFDPPAIPGGLGLNGSNARIEGCWFGVRPDGSEVPSNITLVMNSDGGVFGGELPAQRNVFVNRTALALFRGRAVNNLFGLLPDGRSAASVSPFGPAQGNGSALRATSGQPVQIERNVFATLADVPAAIIARDAEIVDNAFGEAWDGASTHSIGTAVRPGVNTRIRSAARRIRNPLADAIVIESSNLNGPIVIDQPILGGQGKGVVHFFATDVSVRSSIAGTTGVGIDLVGGLAELPNGVTPNDVTDADVGPNGLQNFPELIAAVRGGGSIAVIGLLQSVPDQSYRIVVCGLVAIHPSGHGGCDRVLEDQTIVTTDGGGLAEFTITVDDDPQLAFVGASAAHVITPDLVERTSEFATSIPITVEGALFADGFE